MFLCSKWSSSDLSFVYIFYMIEFPEKPFSAMETPNLEYQHCGKVGGRLKRQAEVCLRS